MNTISYLNQFDPRGHLSGVIKNPATLNPYDQHVKDSFWYGGTMQIVYRDGSVSHRISSHNALADLLALATSG